MENILECSPSALNANGTFSSNNLSAECPLAPAEQLAKLLWTALRDTSESVLITDACLELPGPQIVFANAAFTRMTGYEPHEALGRSPRMLQGPLTDRSVVARLKADLLAARPFEGETTTIAKTAPHF